MDSELTSSETPTTTTNTKPQILKWVFLFLFQISILAVLIFFVGFLAAYLEELPIANPISLPSKCRIVSSSVDLRSSKVCELGLLNQKVTHGFQPFEWSKFRCRYDYYWASVFKVEYIDHISGGTQLGLAEAPNEALPLDCRPSFGAAWLTKDKFKVNKTYGCWYTAGKSKVSLNQDGLFNCQARGPSKFEAVKRYYKLSINLICSWFTTRGRAKYWRWETVIGLITGFSTPFMTLCLLRILYHVKSSLPQICTINKVHVKRACFLVAYFTVVGYLLVLYKRMLGLPKLSFYMS